MVCFHAQQAAEKILKAFLVGMSISEAFLNFDHLINDCSPFFSARLGVDPGMIERAGRRR
ncbi:MAG: HEPN domain-containing protein [Gemmatimonadota bacterium]